MKGTGPLQEDEELRGQQGKHRKMGTLQEDWALQEDGDPPPQEAWMPCRGQVPPQKPHSPPCCAKAALPSGSGCSAGPPAAGTVSAALGAPGFVLQGTGIGVST